jgi:macrodomain Ter protein organizer (MatP/YcbG family)
MEGTKKLAVDLPISTKEKLKALAHENKTTLTGMIIDLIEKESRMKEVRF